MDDELILRAARLEDADAIAALGAEFEHPATADEMRARLTSILPRDDYHTAVAERAGRVVGWGGTMIGISYTENEPFARLLALVVTAGERGRGTGAALVADAEAWARAKGAPRLHLTTALRRKDAHRFYERLGYENTGLRYARLLS